MNGAGLWAEDGAPASRDCRSHSGWRAADALGGWALGDFLQWLPTFAISKLTRARVTVALSGDGGDELFAGYNRYLLAGGNLARVAALPRAFRSAAADMLGAIPEAGVNFVARALLALRRPSMPPDKLRKLAQVLKLDGEGIYLRLVSQNANPETLTLGLCENALAMPHLSETAGPIARMQLFDTCTYLPDDILQKVDRASMAVSLEVRPPFLDHRIVEFAWSLPRRKLLRGSDTKWLLRRVLDRYVPRALVDRPKMGFAIPLADWLRGPLRDLRGLARIARAWRRNARPRRGTAVMGRACVRPTQLGCGAVDRPDV